MLQCVAMFVNVAAFLTVALVVQLAYSRSLWVLQGNPKEQTSIKLPYVNWLCLLSNLVPPKQAL